MKSPLFLFWVIFAIAWAVDLAFDAMPLPFWPLMGGAGIATAIWHRREAHRWPVLGVVGGVLLGLTAAVLLTLEPSDLVFLMSILPCGALIIASTRPPRARPAEQ